MSHSNNVWVRVWESQSGWRSKQLLSTMAISSQAMWFLGVLVQALLTSSTEAQSSNSYVVTCPPEDVNLNMAGLTAGNRLVGAWQKQYSSKYCPGFNITFHSDSWDSASARVCDSSLVHHAVELAGMSGSFFLSQATSKDGWSFHCKRSKQQRVTTALLAAYRGLVVGVRKDGAAAQCIDLLGGGLSRDQLRWIYSAYTFKQLVSYEGWDPSAVPYSDDDDDTHLWSELHENCTNTEILIAFEEFGDGYVDAMDYLYDHIVRSPGETVRKSRISNTSSREELGDYMQANGGAIAIFHLHDTLSREFQDRGLLNIGIKNKEGDVIKPSAKTFESETYPMLKKVTIGLVKDATALVATRPFLEFGYSADGTDILKRLGYWPIEEWKKHSVYTRLGSELGLSVREIQPYCNDGDLEIAGGNTVLPVIRAWKDMYTVGCPSGIDLEGGRATAGARRVCSRPDVRDAVDVGMMSRDFNHDTEAVPRVDTPFVYDCIADDSISAVQIDVGLDGIAVIMAVGSVGEKCVRLLGGLTMDQLRWIYSSYSDSQLEKTGWDPACLANNDFDPTTHLWSELDARCADEEIELVGDKKGEGTFTGFWKAVLTDFESDEVIAENRPSPYVQAFGADALQYLVTGRTAAVAFAGYHFYVATNDVFWAAPLAHESGGPFVAPTEASIGDRTYPLSRGMFIVIRNTADVLSNVRRFVQFGFDHPELIRTTGYAPLPDDRAKEMINRLSQGPYTVTITEQDSDEHWTSSIGLIVGSIVAGLVVVMVVIFAARYYVYSRQF